jgi:transcriptional regulator
MARPNPVWPEIVARPMVVLSVIGDYAYIPSTWRAKPGEPERDGVPTSYYSTVQFTCRAEIVDDPLAKADLLRRQMAHFQPEGGHGPIEADQAPYGRLLPGIRGLLLHIQTVTAKFKYDDHKPVEHRDRVSSRLQDRAAGSDEGTAAQQQRRRAAIGTWTGS